MVAQTMASPLIVSRSRYPFPPTADMHSTLEQKKDRKKRLFTMAIAGLSLFRSCLAAAAIPSRSAIATHEDVGIDEARSGAEGDVRGREFEQRSEVIVA